MDNLIRTISSDGSVMACITDTTKIIANAEQIHLTSAVVTAALGRLMTAASMMGCMLKGHNDSLTLRIKGDGEIGALIAVADAGGNVKGYPANPVVELPLNAKGKLDVGKAVGKGTLYVIKDLGLKEPYIGQVPLVSGEIAEDITSYYAVSEQIPTVCGLGVLVNPNLTVKAAGGFLIQLLPGATEETIQKVEQGLTDVPAVSAMIEQGMTPEDICHRILPGFDMQVLDSFKTQYFCDCSRQRVEKALLSLGKEELAKIIEEDGKAEVNCHFCIKKYRFNKTELEELRKQAK